MKFQISEPQRKMSKAGSIIAPLLGSQLNRCILVESYFFHCEQFSIFKELQVCGLSIQDGSFITTQR